MKPISIEDALQKVKDGKAKLSNGMQQQTVPDSVPADTYTGAKIASDSVYWREYGQQGKLRTGHDGAAYCKVSLQVSGEDKVVFVRLTKELSKQLKVGLPVTVIVKRNVSINGGDPVTFASIITDANDTASNASDEQTIRDQYKEELIANGTNRLAAVKEANDTSITEIKKALGIA